MMCPYCNEELGLNNICINVSCSHFGDTINSLEDSGPGESDKNNFKSENNLMEFSDYNSNIDNLLEIDNLGKYNVQAVSSPIDDVSTYLIEDISTDELNSFIGRNSHYYIKYYSRKKSANRFFSWNWPCFFLSNYWLLYRKIYAPAIILICLNFTFSQIFDLKTYLFITLIFHIILALLSNYIYINHCKRKIDKIKQTTSSINKANYIDILCKKGGTSLIPPMLLLSINILITIFYISIYIVAILNEPSLTSPLHYA